MHLWALAPPRAAPPHPAPPPPPPASSHWACCAAAQSGAPWHAPEPAWALPLRSGCARCAWYLDGGRQAGNVSARVTAHQLVPMGAHARLRLHACQRVHDMQPLSCVHAHTHIRYIHTHKHAHTHTHMPAPPTSSHLSRPGVDVSEHPHHPLPPPSPARPAPPLPPIYYVGGRAAQATAGSMGQRWKHAPRPAPEGVGGHQGQAGPPHQCQARRHRGRG